MERLNTPMGLYFDLEDLFYYDFQPTLISFGKVRGLVGKGLNACADKSRPSYKGSKPGTGIGGDVSIFCKENKSWAKH